MTAVVRVEIAGVSELAAALGDGGALRLLIGRVASDRLSELIGAGLDIPKAWLEAKADQVRAASRHRLAIDDALAGRVLDAAVSDRGLMDRASQRLIGRALQEQGNVEAVALLAAENLAEDPPASENPEIEADFFEQFTAKAQRASSDEMRRLFARILAGEIRKPGTFSLAALHAFSLMDARTAAALERAAAYVTSGFVIKDKGLFVGQCLADISVAQEMGLLREVSLEMNVRVPEKGVALSMLQVPDRWRIRMVEPTILTTEVHQLTTAGKEVFSLVVPQYTEDGLTRLAAAWARIRGVLEIAHITGSEQNARMYYERRV